MAIRFDGNSANYGYKSTGLPPYTSAYTWMAWIETTVDLNAGGVIYSVANVGFTQYDILGTDADGTTLGGGTEAGNVSGTYAAAINTAYHIAMVRSSATLLTIYVNGVSIGTSTYDVSGRGAVASEFLGGIGAYPWDGRLWAEKLWTTALTADEIINEMATVVPKHQLGSIKRWTPFLANNITDAVVDYSGNGAPWVPQGTLTVQDAIKPIPWGGSPQVVWSATPPAGTTAFQPNAFQSNAFQEGGSNFVASGYSLTIDNGTLAFTGQALTFNIGLPVSQDTLAFSGQSATFTLGLPVTNDTLAFSGQSLTAAINLAVAQDTLAFTGSSGNFTLGLPITNATLAFSGQSVTSGYNLAVTNATLAFSGQSITDTIGLAISTAGAMVFTGQEITLQAGSGVTLTIDAGSMVFTGQSAAAAINLALTNDTLAFSGQSITQTLNLPVSNGTMALAGQSFSHSINLALANATVTLSGQVLTSGFNLAVDNDTLAFSGQDITLEIVAPGVNLTIDAGTLDFEGQSLSFTTVFDPTLYIGRRTTIGKGTVGGIPMKNRYSKTRFRQENYKPPTRK